MRAIGRVSAVTGTGIRNALPVISPGSRFTHPSMAAGRGALCGPQDAAIPSSSNAQLGPTASVILCELLHTDNTALIGIAAVSTPYTGWRICMRTLVAVAAAGLIAVAIGFWLNTGSQPTTEGSVSQASLDPSISLSKATTKVPTISIWEMHNQAHLENVPIQEIEDQSVIFAERPGEPQH